MYQRFWELHRRPFDDLQSSDCFFMSEGHQGTLLKLRYAVEQRCEAALLTGASGVGKTMVISRLIREFPEPIGPVAHVTFTQMTSHDLLMHVTEELSRQAAAPTGTAPVVGQLRDFLVKNRERGWHAVLIVDEAHLLRDADAWEMLRLVMNLSAAAGRCLTILFVGQPQMMAALAACPSLEERIAVKCLLRPLEAGETAAYIGHRLTGAGGRSSLFSEPAVRAVHAETGGCPRRINRLCDLAMLVAFAEDCQQVDEHHVHSVTDEILSLGGLAA